MSRVFASLDPAPSTDLVSVAASATINNLAAYTYAAWVYPTAYPETASPANKYSTITSKDFDTAEIDMAFSSINTYIPVTRVLWGIRYGATSIAYSASPNNVIVLNTWQRCVMTFDFSGDKKIHLYLNGVEVIYQAQVALTGAIADDSGGPLTVGDWNGSGAGQGPFVGSIANMEVWNVALTAAQVLADYNGESILDGNLVDNLTFLTNQGSTEPDESGNSNTGAITGTTFSATNPPLPTPPSLTLTPIFTDLFAGNHNPLNPANWQTVTGGGGALQAVSGVVEIVTAPGQGQANYIGSAIPDNQYVQVTVSSILNDGAGSMSLNVRTDINYAGGYYLNLIGSGAGKWIVIVGNVQTGKNLYANTNFPFMAGDTFALAIVGSELYAFHNGTMFAWGTDTGTPTASGLPGLLVDANMVSDTQLSDFITGSAGPVMPSTGLKPVSVMATDATDINPYAAPWMGTPRVLGAIIR